MFNELIELIKSNRKIIAFAIIVLSVMGIIAISAYLILTYGLAQPVPSPTPQPTPVPTPDPTVMAIPSPTATPVPTPEPSPTPAPRATVTPDLNIQASITPLDQYAPNYMVHVDQSATTGVLSVDLLHSDMGGPYAYLNDTYAMHMTLADISNRSVDRIKIRISCVNQSGTGYTMCERERVDTVLLNQSDKISRTLGFQVGADTPPGLYHLRVDIYTDPYGNDSWSGYGCGFETGLNILRLPS